MKRCGLSRRRTVDIDSADVTSSGRSFQICGKARLPAVDRLTEVSADRYGRPRRSATRVKGPIYCGVSLKTTRERARQENSAARRILPAARSPNSTLLTRKQIPFVCRLGTPLEPNSTTRTPATDTTNGQAHNNYNLQQICHIAMPEPSISTCQDVGMWQIFVRWWCSLVVFVAGIRVVEFG